MEKREKIYEGKAKIVYKTDNPLLAIQEFKDSATAFDGKKKGTIKDKGYVNAQVSAYLFKLLEENGIRTHFKELLNEREMVIDWLEMLKVEVIVRNVAAGSLAKRLGYEEGTPLKQAVVELYYKNDELGDPILNQDHILELALATLAQLDEMRAIALKINEILKGFFQERKLVLVDLKLEFGLKDNQLVLADEISPDTCRLWDAETREKLDKDRFRRDLGQVEEAYQEILKRVVST